MTLTEFVDVVIVGARCAGSAAAISFARAGRSVIAIDAAKFPSSTISTHLLWAGGVAEVARLGALERVESLGAPRLPVGFAAIPGAPAIRATYTPIDGIDYGLCVRRYGFDAALVDTARAAGAEVREQTQLLELLVEDGRATGIVVRERGGRVAELRAKLVVGADGRRSAIAKQLGVSEPTLSHHNERCCFYSYFRDLRGEWRNVAAQWRAGRELGTAFPCDGGLVLVLLMPPNERAEAFRRDRETAFARTIDQLPGLSDRLAGCPRAERIIGATNLLSYFRRSSGPGWALVGDAGHFKDPVTAQGIRDALRFGRLLAEQTASVLDDPQQLDHALGNWEAQRDAECLEVYHWSNLMGRADEVGPFDVALYEHFSRPEHAHKLLDVHSRLLRPSEVFPMELVVDVSARPASGDQLAGPITSIGERPELALARYIARSDRRSASSAEHPD
ncbi:MAG: NAD(P)/FAD-dependent oxidoreductase [Acidimicrobiales bacterium]|nr:NAD(P)/FAD-dependent oxidoreductase [Acidimicrobiales bacterium]